MLRKGSFILVLLILLVGISGSLTAQDSMATTAECGADGYTGNFKSIEMVDAMTLKISLCNPDPAFPSKIAFEGFPISPSEYLESTGGGGDLVTTPVGTGPYTLANWDLGNEMVLSRYEGYWGEVAKEPTAVIRWNSEATTRLTELQAGTVDGISNVGTGDYPVVEADPNLKLLPGAITNVLYLGLNNTKPPLDNLDVRQAISHAIDKQRIVDNYFPAGSVVANQFMPPVLFGYTPEVEPLAYDVALANQMLDDAGFPKDADGVRFSLDLNYRDVVRGYLPTPGAVAVDIQAQMAEVGVKVNVAPMESGAFLDAVAAGDVPFFLLGWGADYPDATNFLDFHFGAGSSSTPRFGNTFPEITEPLTRASQLGKPEERYPVYVEANSAIRDLVPMVPIAHGANANGWKASIDGAYVAQVGVTQLGWMEDPDDDNIIWMQNGEPISLYCADETDGETLMACGQINEPLLNYEPDTGEVIPWLASSFDIND
ncbi:MAG: peptide ABC transporter substrate-binding protein, partial [Anaerolineae bacterium]|nr:peptide ABC transporter substrate-binding protein [Anaerolineae bacterium]